MAYTHNIRTGGVTVHTDMFFSSGLSLFCVDSCYSSLWPWDVCYVSILVGGNRGGISTYKWDIDRCAWVFISSIERAVLWRQQ